MSRNEVSALPPGWSDEALLETTRENRGVGVDSGLPDDVRFRVGVARLIRRRIARAEPQDSAPCVFFLMPHVPPIIDSSKCRSVPMLDNGLTPVGSRLWFVAPVVVVGHSLEVDWDDEKVFALAGNDPHMCNAPAVLFETRTSPPEARFYPKGLGNPNVYEPIQLADRSITLNEVFDVIDDVHVKFLVTPRSRTGPYSLWSSAPKHWVSAKAEAIVQTYLRIALSIAFPGCDVREEQTETTGRLDLTVDEVHSDDRSTISHIAVLELKIVKSFGSRGATVPDKDMRDWIREGVMQAGTYAAQRNSRYSALCCFDMRTAFSGNACFSHVRQKARNLSVTLRVWHLFASAKAYREYLASLVPA